MFCKECGKLIQEGGIFCDNCGTEVTKVQVKDRAVEDTDSIENDSAIDQRVRDQVTELADTEVNTGDIAETVNLDVEEVLTEIHDQKHKKAAKKAEKQSISQSKKAEKLVKKQEKQLAKETKKQNRNKVETSVDEIIEEALLDEDVIEEVYKKQHKFRFLKWLIPALALIGLGIFSYFSVYVQTTDYQSMMGRSSRWYFYEDREYDADKEDMVVTVELDTLNAYINNEVIDDIEVKGFTIKQLCFEKGGKVYMSVQKDDGNPVDIIADYDMTIVDDEIVLSMKTKRLGRHIPVISTVVLSTQYDIREMTIPLNTEIDEIADIIIIELLKDQTVSPSTRSEDLELTYNIDGGLIDENATAISEMTILKPEAVDDSESPYIVVEQDYLMSGILDNETFISEIGSTVAEGEFYVNGQKQILLRQNDRATDQAYDIILTFDYNDEDEIIELSQALPYAASKNSDEILDLLQAAFNEVLPTYESRAFTDYHVMDVDNSSNTLKFVVDQAFWTIMVYMNGSDLESWGGNASEDLREMMAGLDNDNIKVVIETGGTADWELAYIDESQNQRWIIEDGQMNLLESIGRQNICRPETLENFVNFAVETYPSENYALLFWNHGGGALYGFGYDEYYTYDSLTLDEMDLALANVVAENDIHFEVVGFDACLMATIETAEMFSDYANYFIASEETEPAYGWDYVHIFEGLSEGQATDGNSFGELVVAGFIEDSVNKNEEELLTLSVVDLSKVEALVNRVDILFSAILEDGERAGFDNLSRIVPQIKAFGGNTEYSGYTDHYDLENLAERLTEFWPLEANNVIAAIDDAVVYKLSGYLATDAGGLSLYLPFYDLYSSTLADDYEPVSFSTQYTEFVKDYVDYRMDTHEDIIDFDYVINTDVDPYEITFSPDYMEFISGVYLNVYMVDEYDDVYNFIDLGMDAWVTETDDPYTYREGFYKWAAIDGWQVPLFISYENDDYIEYETPILLNGEYVTMISAWIYDDDEYVVYGARPALEQATGIQDRNTIEFQEGDEIVLLYDVYDMNSANIDIYEMESDPIIVGPSEVPIMLDYEFETGYKYALQFVIVDYNGNFSYTDYVTFSYTD